MSNTINVNYMTRAYNQYQQKNAAKDQEKEDTRFADSVKMCIRDRCEYYALEGLSQLIHTINLVQERLNPNLQMEGVVFTLSLIHI